MAYRKMKIDDKTYEYVIGKTFTKIKDVGLFENKEYGSPLAFSNKGVVVSPKHVSNMIRGIKERVQYHCKEHNFTTDMLVSDPYSVEIHGKKILVKYCPQCYERRALDI
jgi:hypothetical protein